MFYGLDAAAVLRNADRMKAACEAVRKTVMFKYTEGHRQVTTLRKNLTPLRFSRSALLEHVQILVDDLGLSFAEESKSVDWCYGSVVRTASTLVKTSV